MTAVWRKRRGSMYINGNIAVTFDKDGKFVDLFDRENNILGTDYSCLDREMLINNNTIEIGEKKKRIQAVSIKDLRIVFEQLLSAVYQIYGKYNIYTPLYNFLKNKITHKALSHV